MLLRLIHNKVNSAHANQVTLEQTKFDTVTSSSVVVCGAQPPANVVIFSPAQTDRQTESGMEAANCLKWKRLSNNSSDLSHIINIR
jgi:hypothetical protein